MSAWEQNANSATRNLEKCYEKRIYPFVDERYDGREGHYELRTLSYPLQSFPQKLPHN